MTPSSSTPREKYLPRTLVILAVLAAAAPLFLNSGFLNTRAGGDSPFLLFRLHQLYAALSDGVFPVRWMPDAAFGLGYPFFSYYAALPYYVAALFKFIGFSTVFSLKLTHLLGFGIAAWGAFAWVRAISGDEGSAALASAAYTFAPFHMVNLYVRGDSLSEFWAMALYPLILLALQRAAERPDSRRIALVGLSFGALLLTHNVSALIFSPFIGLYALGCGMRPHPPASHSGDCQASRLERGSQAPARKGEVFRVLLLLALGGMLGLGLAVWFVLPALAEIGFARLADQTTGFFFYGNHFRGATLVQPGLLFDYGTGSETTSPFAMGLAQAILIAPGGAGTLIRLSRARSYWRDGFILFAFALATLMITPLSRPVWEALPPLALAQFPWRFLSVQALFGAALTGGIVGFIPRSGEGKATRLILPAALTLLIALSALGGLRPDFIPISEADITPTRLGWYESFSGNIGSTIRYEYLPRWVHPRPYTSDILLERAPRPKFMNGAGSGERVEARAAWQVWTFTVSDGPARIALPIHYWPGWKAEAGGEGIALTPLEGLGYLQLDLPEGTHTVRLWLGRTPIRLAGEIISLAALLILAALWRPRFPRWNWLEWGLVASGILSLVTFGAVLRSIPEQVPAGIPTADFGQQAYFYVDQPVRFADGAAWREASDTLPPGWSVTLTTPPPQAVQGGPEAAFFIESSISAGLYYPALTHYGEDGSIIPALTASGAERGPVHLAPIVVLNTSELPPVTASPFGPVHLRGFDALSASGTLYPRFVWEADRELPQHYQIGLRLFDAAGVEWAGLDTQAGGAGSYPTGLWEPGESVFDVYRLDLPPGTPPGLYSLRVVLYDDLSLQPVGEAILEGLPYSGISPLDCAAPLTPLGESLAYTHADLISLTVLEGDPLAVEIGWAARETPAEAYRLRWTLAPLAGGDPFSMETELAPGSDPREWLTGETPCGAYVLGRQRLALPRDLPRGEYDLSIAVLGEEGEIIGDPLTPGRVRLEGRDRAFDPPDLEQETAIYYGDQLALWGYTLSQSADALTLDVAWGAAADPDDDYTFFVHLIDTASGEIAAQIDAMPRAFSYPTSLWIGGEVVAETLTLDLSGVPPGVYQIGIGWYHPARGRLEALDADGVRLPADRFLLPEMITIRQ